MRLTQADSSKMQSASISTNHSGPDESLHLDDVHAG
jgi:hypothetical protein